jgi:hypothetical protein
MRECPYGAGGGLWVPVPPSLEDAWIDGYRSNVRVPDKIDALTTAPSVQTRESTVMSRSERAQVEAKNSANSASSTSPLGSPDCAGPGHRNRCITATGRLGLATHHLGCRPASRGVVRSAGEWGVENARMPRRGRRLRPCGSAAEGLSLSDQWPHAHARRRRLPSGRARTSTRRPAGTRRGGPHPARAAGQRRHCCREQRA